MKQFIKAVLHPSAISFYKRYIKKQFDEINLIVNFLDKEKGVMIDVGALDGSSFMPFLLKGWKVYAFEPDNKNYKKLSDYLKKWHLNIHLEKKALSDKEEIKTFYTSNLSTGIPSLLNFNKSQVPSHTLTTTTLSKFIKQKKIQEITFLKIDVEGYDLKVLQGFDFSKVKPKLIMCEFEDKKTKLLNYTVRDIAKFLEKQGYYLIFSIWHPIKEYGMQHEWKKLSISLEDINEDDWGNIIAFENKPDYKMFIETNNVK